ncbi:Histone RNA hairpin-binding protein [Fukomys damarensis]|uniref:Histone RNA hairpin-binding protein n=1 Tax=Fukomys damarensis TaxID=885580 RepID=A0A091DER3_FUKDA|nr:Histone RNA hairpin-binding protein [Fukomys damarensis]
MRTAVNKEPARHRRKLFLGDFGRDRKPSLGSSGSKESACSAPANFGDRRTSPPEKTGAHGYREKPFTACDRCIAEVPRPSPAWHPPQNPANLRSTVGGPGTKQIKLRKVALQFGEPPVEEGCDLQEWYPADPGETE